MKVFCDASKTEACIVLPDGEEIIIPFDPPPKTHNEAEYNAVLIALILAPWGAEIYTDSQLVVRQVGGKYKCNHAHLAQLLGMVQAWLRWNSQTLVWIPREENPAGKILEGRK